MSDAGDPATQEQWLDVALLRQGLYRLLAGTFQPPTADLANVLREAALVLVDMGVTELPLAGAVTPLLRALADPGDLDAANIEHVRLFESGVDGALCPPTESYWLADSAGSVIGQLQRDCRQLGMAVRHDVTLEPDHITRLLEAQSALCAEEARAWNLGDDDGVTSAIATERWFLERHMARWVSAFASRLRQAEPSEPYAQAGEAVESMVQHDRHLLAAMDVSDELEPA